MTVVPQKKSNAKTFAAIALVVLLVGAGAIFFSLNQLLYTFNSNTPGGVSAVHVSHWSGYLITLGEFQNRTEGVTAISASWVVPQIIYSDNDTYSSVWLGVGGYGEDSLIQAGTEQQCVNGRIEYFGWYELLPDYIVRIPNLQVNPGDSVTVSIDLQNQDLNLWQIKFTDFSNGGTFEKSDISYHSSQKSAEWIVERPMVNKATSTLSNFGSASLNDCTATINGESGPVGNFTYAPIIMVDSNDNALTTTSQLNSNGSGFNVTYIDPSTYITVTPAAT
jgi:hypothetical protein